jgi:anaerobic dimethyl sulfoxide reductase subunit C (anchor subunit)
VTDHRKEWPLAVFTVAVQFACGLALAATVVDLRGKPGEMAAIRPLAIAVFPLLAAGFCGSLFHLGRPLAAWKALANLRHSRLSLEVFSTMLFAAFALVYAGSWLARQAQGRPAIGVATSLLGLAAVWTSARVHMLETQPLFQSGWLPASFFSTTLVLGGFAAAVFVPSDSDARRIFLGAGLAGSLGLLLSAFWMSKRVWRAIAAPRQPRWGAWFLLYLLLVGVFPAGLVFFPPVPILIAPLAAFALIVLGALLGRMMVYALRDVTPRF